MELACPACGLSSFGLACRARCLSSMEATTPATYPDCCLSSLEPTCPTCWLSSWEATTPLARPARCLILFGSGLPGPLLVLFGSPLPRLFLVHIAARLPDPLLVLFGSGLPSNLSSLLLVLLGVYFITFVQLSPRTLSVRYVRAQNRYHITRMVETNDSFVATTSTRCVPPTLRMAV